MYPTCSPRLVWTIRRYRTVPRMHPQRATSAAVRLPRHGRPLPLSRSLKRAESGKLHQGGIHGLTSPLGSSDNGWLSKGLYPTMSAGGPHPGALCPAPNSPATVRAMLADGTGPWCDSTAGILGRLEHVTPWRSREGIPCAGSTVC